MYVQYSTLQDRYTLQYDKVGSEDRKKKDKREFAVFTLSLSLVSFTTNPKKFLLSFSPAGKFRYIPPLYACMFAMITRFDADDETV